MKIYQVWHDKGWPQSRINERLGGWPPSRFPDDYVHVANVKAKGLRHVVELTSDKGNVLQGNAIPWEKNPGIESLSRSQRDTDIGDVIVDPQGKPYLMERNSFKEISAEQSKESQHGTSSAALRSTKYDALVAHEIRESIAIRMESFGDEFQRVASTVNQGDLADSFSYSVHDIVGHNPLTAADLEPLGKWLGRYGDLFEQVATSREQKELAASFKEFIREMTSPEVKDAFQRPLVNELVNDIVVAMADGAADGVRFGQLSFAEKKQFLAVGIDWNDYINRGLDFGGESAVRINRMIDNAIAGKPKEQWMGQPAPLATSFEDLLNRRSNQGTIALKDEKDLGIER